MLVKLARGMFVVVVVAMIAAYAASVANSSPPPMAPGDYIVQWC